MQAAQRYRRANRPHAILLALITMLVSGGAALQARQIEAPVYTIQAGDTLDISVLGHSEWSLSVTVRPDGRINYPALGEVEVAGLAVQQLIERIEHALGPGGRHLRNPQVHINVTTLRTPTAYVLGAVSVPGPIELPRGVDRAAQIITVAGGPTLEGDITEVTLYREDGTTRVINVQAERDGAAEQTLVYAGDVLMVPEAEVRFVGVLGQVGTPGELPLPPGQTSISLLDLMVTVGGVGEIADRDRAMILHHDGPVDVVSIDSVLKREIEPPMLKGGDVLWIPPLPPEPDTEYFTVTGAIGGEGQYPYHDGMTLADALALGGQLSEAANPKEITIIRADGSTETVDILPMISGRDVDIARTPIGPDDIVFVPARDESYAMLGAVEQTGVFMWDENMRITDALAKAGGLSKDAAAARVMLVRRGPQGRPPTVLQLDARKLLEGENEAANWKLMPGDTVYVPNREERNIGSTLAGPLSILGILGAIDRLFD